MSEHICPKCGKPMPATCPVAGCGKSVEVYSRIVGYLRPVSNWCDGKKQEFADRTPFVIRKIDEHQKSE